MCRLALSQAVFFMSKMNLAFKLLDIGCEAIKRMN